MRGIGASAVSARASHGLQKSLERLRAQRSAPPVTSGSKARSSTRSVVNGGSATSRYEARERDVLLLVKGRRLVEARRSSSRERRVLYEGTAGPFRISVRAGCATHLTTEGTPDRESVRLSRGPRGTGLGGLRVTEHGFAKATRAPNDRGGGDRGVRDGRVVRARGKKTPPRPRFARSSKWESRCEPRLSPASFASGGPSCPVLAEWVSGPSQREREKRRFA